MAVKGQVARDTRDARAARDAACAAYRALIDQVAALADVVQAVGNDVARPTGQSLARCQVLSAVASAPAPVATIACTLGLARQSVQRVADLLVEDGLGRYRPNPAHRRAKLLELTPEGRTVLEGFRHAQDECALRTVDGLDVAGLEIARQTLRDLQHRLENGTKRTFAG